MSCGAFICVSIMTRMRSLMANGQPRMRSTGCTSTSRSRSIPCLPLPHALPSLPIPPPPSPTSHNSHLSQANISAISRGRSTASSQSPLSQDDAASPRHGLLSLHRSNSGEGGGGGATESPGQFPGSGSSATYQRNGSTEGVAPRSPAALLNSLRSSPSDAQDRFIERAGYRKPGSEQRGTGFSGSGSYVAADAASKVKGRLSTMDFINAGSSRLFSLALLRVSSFCSRAFLGLRPEAAAHVSDIGCR